MKINLPRQVEKAISIIENNGYEAYLVGGAVRDSLLGLNPKDYDLTTSAPVIELIKIFKAYKVIETGLKHGTITVFLDHFELEITEFRDDQFTLKGDVELRDFTINSLAYNPTKGVIDLVGGIKDINDKVLQLNNHDEEIIIKDPLRILRGIRQAFSLGFTIEAKTKELFFKHQELIHYVSKERIRDEINKILINDDIEKLFTEFKDIMFIVVPELKEMDGLNQLNKYHIYDVYQHTLKVVEYSEKRKIHRLAALFHDIGKPKTFTIDEKGIGHFYGHPKVSAEIAKKIMKRLKYSNKEIYQVSQIILFHDYPLTPSYKVIKRFMVKYDTTLIDQYFDIKQADILSQNPAFISRLDDLEEIKEIAYEIIENNECLRIDQLEIKGIDLINIGIKTGPIFNEIFNELLEKVVQGKLQNNKQDLLQYVKNEYNKEV